jgi:hypothetical protein
MRSAGRIHFPDRRKTLSLIIARDYTRFLGEIPREVTLGLDLEYIGNRATILYVKLPFGCSKRADWLKADCGPPAVTKGKPLVR